METDVAAPAQEADAPAVQTDSPTGSREPAATSEQPSRHDTWRWIPDPAEDSIPTHPSGRDAGPSDALIRACTQLGLLHWR
jgi:hypothetical protein